MQSKLIPVWLSHLMPHCQIFVSLIPQPHQLGVVFNVAILPRRDTVVWIIFPGTFLIWMFFTQTKHWVSFSAL